MSNKESCAPMGLVELTKEFTKLRANRKRLDDLTDRLEIAMDAKRAEATSIVLDKPDYTKQLAASLETGAKYFHSVFEAGREAGHEKGYEKGYKAGRDSEMQASDKRDRELLEFHNIDVDKLFADTAKMIEDRDDDDIDEDERDQYPPNYGGTK